MSEQIKKEIVIDVLEEQNLSEQQAQLVHEAKSAALRAYSPYSNFQVGAALLLEDGSVVTGNNQENSAYPSGLCAERVAIFSARAHNPKAKFKAIAITAKKAANSSFISVTPCGSCRQVMSEYEGLQENTIEVIMGGDDGKYYVSDSVDNLLPFKFSGKYLL